MARFDKAPIHAAGAELGGIVDGWSLSRPAEPEVVPRRGVPFPVCSSLASNSRFVLFICFLYFSHGL